MSDDYLPSGWERVKSSPFTRVARNAKRQLYYKQFLTRSPAFKLKAQVRGSRATRARLNAQALLLAGIDAPHSVLWGKLPGGGEYLFTVEVPGESIGQWLRETTAGHDADTLRLRRQLLSELGTFIGRVHATGFIHGDLAPDNILAAKLQDKFRFTLMNNERNSRRTPIPGRLLLRNLIQLNMLSLDEAGRTDRMRFFRAWRRQMRELSPVEAKILAVESYRRALRRLPVQADTAIN
ncbi:Uncharacterised protein [Halioglobus japonicus]|nr:Uncharacterised protein [Halioglobus japonicus]